MFILYYFTSHRLQWNNYRYIICVELFVYYFILYLYPIHYELYPFLSSFFSSFNTIEPKFTHVTKQVLLPVPNLVCPGIFRKIYTETNQYRGNLSKPVATKVTKNEEG